MKRFTPEWIAWIKTNVEAGVNKDTIFKVLRDAGFKDEDIQRETGHTPTISKERMANPYRAMHEFLPNYTQAGFAKLPVPTTLFRKILEFYRAGQASQKDEFVEGEFIVNPSTPSQAPSTLIDLTDALRTEIHDTLKPLVEAWCGLPVKPSYVYGIRTYRDKAVLKPHRDRIETHIFGIILNVDQVAREDWLLMIEDHAYDEHQIILKPGEMLFYESARLKHGRPIPFEGSVFANIFCHFTPTGYIPPN
jgi:prolyl 4-hydroxylase